MDLDETRLRARGDHLPRHSPNRTSPEHHCVGCPGLARGLLADMLAESASSCAFESVALEAREEIPARWSERYTFAFVRRGYLVRQHLDATGQPTAVDAVGPGCAFPLHAQYPTTGYAVNRAIVCLCDEDALQRALGSGGRTAMDLHQLMAEAFERLERLASARGRGSAASKLAALLCVLSDTLHADRPQSDIPGDFLQRDLAALLSIRHESVCRVLRGFADEQLATREAEGLQILDRNALQRI